MISSQIPLLKYHMSRVTVLLFLLFTLIVRCTNGQMIDHTRQAEYFEEGNISLFPSKSSKVAITLTLADGSQKFVSQEPAILGYNDSSLVIHVSEQEAFQSMDGFGFALTGGSAIHLNSMSSSARKELLQELFGQSPGELNFSFIRVSIGASDLDQTPFSYVDAQDYDLDSFSLTRDKQNMIPIIKEILEINPDLKIMASPWSPPIWMKSNNSSIGGSLLPIYYSSYASYFVRYIKAMKQEGINIEFISIQNEPLHDGNNPSLYMPADEQAAFIKKGLGPRFEQEGIETKVLIYDHNVDRIDYPISILDDDEANKYVYGSAFHLYAGDISDISEVHSLHPDKHIYFTEQWYGAHGNFSEDLKWHIREVIIGSVRNWSKGVIEWNLTSSSSLEPHTDGGCNQCLGAITVDGDEVIRNAGYYVMGHVSSFVPPGSKRINSTYYQSLPNVAFRTPENDIVLLVLNDTEDVQQIGVNQQETKFSVNLKSGSVATFKWKNE